MTTLIHCVLIGLAVYLLLWAADHAGGTIRDWWARMQARPSVQQVMAMVAPHIGRPIEHARAWVASHRPRY